MAFKMNGSPAKMGTISGTAGHSSALKMKAEANAASALKQTIDGVNQKTSLGGKIKSLPALFPGGETYSEAKASQRAKGNVSNKTKKANAEVAEKKATKSKTKKGSYVKKGGKSTGNMKDYALNTQGRRDEYDARGWAHDKTTEVAATTTKPTKVEKVTKKAAEKVEKIESKSAKKVAEVGENLTKKGAKYAKKGAKKTFGKGSKEHLTAKKVHLQAKEADRQGEGGGKKQGFFRKLSSKINKKRQAKVDKKLAE